jgi:EAL domain-containing protein (putative c-di-GMP-specific phosphodiesterase class I)/ActR/RegA family two-component response regulator
MPTISRNDSAGTPAPGVISPSGNHRLLVCDDDGDFAEEVADIAAEGGYITKVVTDSSFFIEAVANFQPQLVILDLNMPGLDGFDLLNIVRGKAAIRSLVLVSGSDSRILLTARRIAEDLGYPKVKTLSKPIDRVMLLSTLQENSSEALSLDLPAIDRAFEDGELILHFQPKVNLKTGAVTSVEALLRWRHDRFGLLPPRAFMDVLVEFDQMSRLSQFVIERGVAQVAAWEKQGINLAVAVNVNARSLDQSPISQWISSALMQHRLAPDRLVIEVTETEVLGQGVKTMETMSRLRMMGVGLSLDDFGSGYSELRSLYRMPFSEIKIDSAFVTEAARSDVGAKFFSALVGLGHSLGLEICAEGIENAETFSAARAASCTLGQGYYMSRPVSPEQITNAYLRSGSLTFGSSF